MIPAKKGGVWGHVLQRYVAWKLRSSFRGLWHQGTLPTSERPLLVYANHCSFWDGFVAHALCARTGLDGYCLMEEENLRRYRFLTRLGAFSVQKGPGGSARASLRYALALLERPGAAVFVFPEGALRPFGEPLRLERGVAWLARASGALCLPVALRYVLFEHELPDVLVDVGGVHAPLASLEDYAVRLSEGVDRLARARGVAGFSPLLPGRRGVAERWDAVRGMRRETA